MRKASAKEHLFTVIMDFEGTTSASQLTAVDAADALEQWRSRLSSRDIYGLTDRQRKRLLVGFSEPELGLRPTPLTGLRNTWYASLIPGKGSAASLHIAATRS